MVGLCLLMDAPYDVYTTKNEDYHDSLAVYQQDCFINEATPSTFLFCLIIWNSITVASQRESSFEINPTLTVLGSNIWSMYCVSWHWIHTFRTLHCLKDVCLCTQNMCVSSPPTGYSSRTVAKGMDGFRTLSCSITKYLLKTRFVNTIQSRDS